MTQPTALCIAGMHRSGTSLIANWLAACGLVVADNGLIPPSPDNPLGFGEDAEFVRLQSRSIQRRRRFTAGWRAAPVQALDFDRDELVTASQLLAVRQEKYPLWGWKDPRSTLFLHQWKALLPTLKVLIVWRPCDEVVFSLLKRALHSRTRRLVIEPLWAVRLWRAYNRLACDYVQAYPEDTLILPLHRLLAADHAALDLVSRRLGVELTYRPLASLFKPELLNRQQPPALLSLFCRLLACTRVENRLQMLSASLDGPSPNCP